MRSREQPAEARPGGTDELSGAGKLGRTIFIKGELTGSENLTISGRVEGRIDLPDHLLTIEPDAVIKADIVAKTVVTFGSVIGGVNARERLEIRRTGSIVGKVVCGCLALHDGAHFEGRVEMGKRAATSK